MDYRYRNKQKVGSFVGIYLLSYKFFKWSETKWRGSISPYYSVTYEILKILNIFVSFWENDEK